MKPGKLSYRLTPVHIAIALAISIPYAQADCAKGGSASCSLLLANGQINYALLDGKANKAIDDQGLSDWNPHYSITQNKTINNKLNDYAIQVINNELVMHDRAPVVSKHVLDIIKKAESNKKADSNKKIESVPEVKSSLIINGSQSVVMHANSKSAIHIPANKVTVKTTGNESKGVYYVDYSDSNHNASESNTDARIAIASAANNVSADHFNIGTGSFANIDVNPQVSLQHISAVNSVTETAANPSKIHISSDSAKAVKAFNGDSGIVTIYNSGQFENAAGLSSLVYSDIRPVTIANTLGAETVSGVYARLLENDNVTIHNAATIIGEFNIAEHGTYVSNLNIFSQETASSLSALNHAALINKNTAHKALQTNKTKTNGIVAVQNLNYITTKDSKLTAVRLFNQLGNINKPSAIQVGFEVKDTILSGLEKPPAVSDGMINIRANKDSIGQRIEIKGNYVVNNNLPYFDAKSNNDEGNITGNITIYDTKSTKVYVNNTTIYFDGEQDIGAIDIVDVGENSAGLGSHEMDNIIRASQYKQYQVSPVNDNVDLVSFSVSSTKSEKGKKPKLGA